MKIKSYYPVLASWIITLLLCGTSVGVRFYGFPKWMDLSNLTELAMMFFGLIMVGGPILSLLWGVCGLIEDKKKMVILGDGPVALWLYLFYGFFHF